MDEQELAQLAEAHRPKGDYNCPACDANVHPCVVNALVAEVRRLRAELYNREHTRTVSTAPVIGPEAVR